MWYCLARGCNYRYLTFKELVVTTRISKERILSFKVIWAVSCIDSRRWYIFSMFIRLVRAIPRSRRNIADCWFKGHSSGQWHLRPRHRIEQAFHHSRLQVPVYFRVIVEYTVLSMYAKVTSCQGLKGAGTFSPLWSLILPRMSALDVAFSHLLSTFWNGIWGHVQILLITKERSGPTRPSDLCMSLCASLCRRDGFSIP